MPAKKYIVTLTEDEKATLENLINNGKSPAYKIKRVNILLKADTNSDAWSDTKIAKAFKCHRTTVEEVRKRIVTQGLEAAIERKKQDMPSRKAILDGDGEAQLIKIACSKAPEGYGGWTLRLLAEKLIELEIVKKITHETVRKTLKKMNLNLTCENAG